MRFTVDTALTPAKAFDAVADFGRLADWDPFVSRVEIEGDELAVGTAYTLRSPIGMSLRYEVVELDRPNRVVYRGGARRGGSVDTLAVTADEVATTVTIDSVLWFTGWVRMIGPFVRALVWLGGRLVSLPALRRRLRTIRS